MNHPKLVPDSLEEEKKMISATFIEFEKTQQGQF